MRRGAVEPTPPLAPRVGLSQNPFMATTTVSIQDLPPEEFELVWPLFRSIVRAGDTYALDSATSFEEARRIWTEPPARSFVALQEGAVVGTYMLRPAQPGLGNHVANAGYMVATEHRRKGIARQLCEHSLEVAREAGFTAMLFSFVVATNETAIRLWQSCGFAVVGRVPKAFRHSGEGLVDALIMHRFL